MLLIMPVPGHIAITVIKLNHIAITGTFPGPDYNTITYRQDLRAFLACEIQTLLLILLAGKRVIAFAKL